LFRQYYYLGRKSITCLCIGSKQLKNKLKFIDNNEKILNRINLMTLYAKTYKVLPMELENNINKMEICTILLDWQINIAKVQFT
jgi:hypothetical protein